MPETRRVVGWSRTIYRELVRLGSGEYDRSTLRSVPSWGVSFLLHALLLLILALMIRYRPSGHPEATFESSIVDTALGELTSLAPAKQSGDPFTLEQSLNPPSIGLEPEHSGLQMTGQPHLASLTHYAPSLAGPSPLSGTLKIEKASAGGLRLPELAASVVAPFSGRSGLTRAKLVRREGGSAQSEQSVEDGLDWLVRHQREDGSWSLNFQDHCQGTPCPAQPAMESDTAATGLALLPLLGAGYIHTVKSKHQEAVRRGLAWLIDHQEADGDLFTGPPGSAYLYSHAIASMAICEGLGLSGDPKLQKPAARAIQFIVNCQDPSGGGWRYRPGQEGDTSVFGWQIFALRSGNMAGIKIPKKVLAGCRRYLDQASDQKKVVYSYQPGRGASAVMTAEGLVSRQLLGWQRDLPALVKGVGQVAAHLQEGGERNIYYWYYATQLLHNMRNEQWERWNPKIREGLIRLQVKDDSCAKGSWDPFSPEPDIWAARAGRLYLTSMSILTLEVYYRYLPLYRTADDDQEKMDSILKADDGPDDQKPDPAAKKAEAKKAGLPEMQPPSGDKVVKPEQKKTDVGGLE
jgi:Squalene-hopene cyclase C-terminal domain/Prenyltransferase and squalene oxidase repeat